MSTVLQPLNTVQLSLERLTHTHHCICSNTLAPKQVHLLVDAKQKAHLLVDARQASDAQASKLDTSRGPQVSNVWRCPPSMVQLPQEV